jgi:hypothetical protein
MRNIVMIRMLNLMVLLLLQRCWWWRCIDRSRLKLNVAAAVATAVCTMSIDSDCAIGITCTRWVRVSRFRVRMYLVSWELLVLTLEAFGSLVIESYLLFVIRDLSSLSLNLFFIAPATLIAHFSTSVLCLTSMSVWLRRTPLLQQCKHFVSRTNTHRQTNTDMHTYRRAYIHADIQAYIHTYGHTYTHTYIHTYVDLRDCVEDPTNCVMDLTNCDVDPTNRVMDPTNCVMDPTSCVMDPTVER